MGWRQVEKGISLFFAIFDDFSLLWSSSKAFRALHFKRSSNLPKNEENPCSTFLTADSGYPKIFKVFLFNSLLFTLGNGKKRVRVNRDLFDKGCVNTLEEGLSSAQKIGFPVMIKVRCLKKIGPVPKPRCSKIGKKCNFKTQKYKNTFFAFSKMAKNQFLHKKKV